MEPLYAYYLVAVAESCETFCARFPHPVLVKRPSSDEPRDRSDGESEKILGQLTDWTPTLTDPGREIPAFVHEWQVGTLCKTRQYPPFNRIVVGRSRVCDLFLPSPSVSKMHAHFHIEEHQVRRLSDNHSSNGTYVNGKRLAPDEAVAIAPGDVLRFGRLEVELLDPVRFYGLLTTT